jgi:hypothetical protein
MSDLPRKSVEPIALAGGTAVRPLQEFLTHHVWDHARMRDQLQRRVVRDHMPAPGAPHGKLGVIGLIDETGTPKKGDKTRRAAAAVRLLRQGGQLRRHRPSRLYLRGFQTLIDSTRSAERPECGPRAASRRPHP